MKIFNRTNFLIAATAALTMVTGCKKLLTEKPESDLYPKYFTTAGGVQAAITGVYQDLRSNFSGEGIVYCYNGTDENIVGGSGGNGANILNSYNGLNSTNTPDLLGLYTDINTLNGAIQYSSAITDAATRAQYVAQAQFLRGFIYFYLVQTYGGTTATQKSGIPLHLTYNTSASTADAPSPLSDIYNAIIADFTTAATNLPATITGTNPFSAAGVGKSATSAVANAYLAKTYLTRGYNSEVAQPGDFQSAATLTASLISNKATYGLDLWQDYNDEHKPANDYGKENMFNIDYGGASDPTYTGYTLQGSGGSGINQLYVLARFNYVNTGVDNVTGIDAVPQKMSSNSAMLRDVYGGRPYTRLAPNKLYTMDVAFADQVHDCRYDATFQTYWICNKAGVSGTSSTGTSKGQLTPASNVSLSSYQVPIGGDTSILMPSQDVTMARRDAFKGVIVTPKQFNNTIFPTVKKFDDPTRTATGDFSSRPIVLMRFSEVYLMNAEANYMLNNITAAATSLNVLRARAAYRTPADAATVANNQASVTAANMAAVNSANAAAMLLTGTQLAQLAIPNNTTVGSAPCGMDLILEEYSREFYGDPRRWYDLVRTNQLVRRATKYNSFAAPYIQPYHTRRPIPQREIQNVLSGPAYPQNNGY
ncbi:putative outer membrane starch-binding protein [Mucilaginibacter gracilis]|uniref:Putative outer membrane starch-binding protein n=1 Tax=Mucilaginibacter gracilis TaxID=423350 RepID=A0A495IYY7_9SPHI|nr:RagB/SusD family nutrient uptake outer membrane protein [Mucilaginibacter gracilis]RKR81782.1 putative outer membrane starch-binding protein [Mucilaginibacter gracilis]